jgi:hypothetical protein
MRPDAFDRGFVAKLVAAALLVAVLCNGASVYLKRTGLIDRDAYGAYWSMHCNGVDPAHAMAPAGARCCANATGLNRVTNLENVYGHYIFETAESGLALRLVKDLLGLALIAFSVLAVARRAAPAPTLREAWPVYLLAGYAMIEFLASAHFNGALVATVGLRAFMFAMIALVAQWLAPHLGVIARSLGALLLLQALLIPYELFHGIHLHDHWTPLYIASRASGTLVLPNSLGIFAVTALAFCYSFSDARARLALPCAAALGVVIFSGSGTGMVCASLLLILMLKDRIGDDRRAPLAMAGAIAGAIVVVALLPVLAGRDIFNSLFGEGGRLDAMASVFARRGPLEALFGSGLGTAKILGSQLQDLADPHALGVTHDRAAHFTDSTITGLVMEIGLLGAAIFYAGLAWAGLRDRRARPFYWVVALCSLTVNITVLFPVNFLLGLAWAHSAWRGRHA